MTFDALLVVDIQAGLLDDGPHAKNVFLHTVQHLLAQCRTQGVPVIFLQHDGGVGDTLAHGTQGWALAPEVAPLPGETVIEKRYNSAFRGTGLRALLDKLQAKNILLCGMQTEHCIDATCKVAFEYGYHVTIVRGATTTFDTDFATGAALCAYYEDKIWDGRYAQLVALEALG